MKRIKEFMSNIDDGKYTSREIVLTGMVLFLLGILIGSFCSPKKHQVIGSYNGNGTAGFLEYDEENEESKDK